MSHSQNLGRAIVVLATAAAFGCSKSDAPKIPLSSTSTADSVRAAASAHALIGPAAKTALDSGNAAFRKKSYADALTHYRSASMLAPQHAAPFFGIYMVARAMNDTVLADSALSDIRRRNGPLAAVPHSQRDSATERMHEMIRRKAGA